MLRTAEAPELVRAGGFDPRQQPLFADRREPAQTLREVLGESLRWKEDRIAMALSLIPYLFLWAPILLGQIANSGEGTAWVKKPAPT